MSIIGYLPPVSDPYDDHLLADGGYADLVPGNLLFLSLLVIKNSQDCWILGKFLQCFLMGFRELFKLERRTHVLLFLHRFVFFYPDRFWLNFGI